MRIALRPHDYLAMLTRRGEEDDPNHVSITIFANVLDGANWKPRSYLTVALLYPASTNKKHKTFIVEESFTGQ